MKILIINKFLYPNGGSETYIFKLGEELTRQGHEVQYFGMEHEGRCVGNNVNSYTKDMDFHGGSKLSKILYPIKTIYNSEAAHQIRKVLDDFEPDVCHLNNFNYQLTPSIIVEINRWRKKTGRACRIVFTAHDYQLVCPNHMCNIPATHENCEKCLKGQFSNCFKNKCIHNSRSKSLIGSLEAMYWKKRKTYELIDAMICCSYFIKTKLDNNPVFATRTVMMQNFVDGISDTEISGCHELSGIPDKYILYFGRFSEEKGIKTLIDVCKKLNDIKFVFAGSGEYAEEIEHLDNAINLGFVKGMPLVQLIRNAAFSVYPSEWYENCPFSVMEALSYGVPVVGSRIGGVPELIKDNVNGVLFEPHNAEQLCAIIKRLSENDEELTGLREGARNTRFTSLREYTEKLVNDIYNE